MYSKVVMKIIEIPVKITPLQDTRCPAKNLHSCAWGVKKLWITYIAIYLYGVGGNPTPSDQFWSAAVHRILQFQGYTNFGMYDVYALKVA